jgi:hypothetical protein
VDCNRRSWIDTVQVNWFGCHVGAADTHETRIQCHLAGISMKSEQLNVVCASESKKDCANA